VTDAPLRRALRFRGLLARVAGLSPLAFRLILGGIAIVIYLMCAGRRLPRGLAAVLALLELLGDRLGPVGITGAGVLVWGHDRRHTG